MEPPIYSTPPTGSKPQQYLHLARMFWNAAMPLPQYVNNEQNWPAYALRFHAAELALKAFCDQAVLAGQPSERAPNHDLNGWYQIGLKYGLPTDSEVAVLMDALTILHGHHYARYPDNRKIAIPDLSVFDDLIEWLINVASKSINPR